MRIKRLKARPTGKLAVLILSLMVMVFLLTFRLGSLPGPGLSPSEKYVAARSASWSAVIQNPTFLPVTALHRAIDDISPLSRNLNSRLPSVILAVLTFAMVIYILLRWYGQRTAILGCIALGVSAWFLHVGRSGSFDIAYYAAIPTLLTAHLTLYYAERRDRLIWFWLICMGLLIYIPGLIWLVLLNVIWQRSELKEGFAGLKQWWQPVAAIGLIVLMLIPLGYGLWNDHSAGYALSWLGTTDQWPAWLDPLKAAGYSVLFIFARAPADPALWLGHLPVLDIFMAVMLLMGIYFYARHWRADRSKLLLAIFVLSIILTSIQGQVSRSLIVPLLYLVAAGGIAYALHLWLRLFPRNPLARGFGIGLVGLALALSCLYNLRLYFVAWPHHQDTRTVYSVEPANQAKPSP